MPPEITLRAEESADDAAVESLYAAAFGPGRHARTAFRVRGDDPHDRSVSFVAERERLVIGAIRQSRVVIGSSPAYLLGPLAVAQTAAKRGTGRALLERAIAAAQETVADAIVLIGDEPFYGPSGFRRVAPSQIVLAGPTEPHRLLVLGLRADVKGQLLSKCWPSQ